MTHTLAALALLTTGYLIGRWQPARRASDWANWQKYDSSLRRHSARWWAVCVLLSVENLLWLATHPVQGWDAWQHRNDPPPPRSPAVRILDPDEAAKRRDLCEGCGEPRNNGQMHGPNQGYGGCV